MKFPDPSTIEGLVHLDNYLLDKSYMVGVEPTQADVEIFEKVSQNSVKKYENVSRWFSHMKSLSSEFKSLKGFEDPGSNSTSSSSNLRKVEDCECFLPVFASRTAKCKPYFVLKLPFFSLFSVCFISHIRLCEVTESFNALFKRSRSIFNKICQDKIRNFF